MSERISIVGLGQMGNAIAERLIKQCQPVSGWTGSINSDLGERNAGTLISLAYDEA